MMKDPFFAFFLESNDDEILKDYRPEVSILLTADDEEVRPSLHLNAELLLRLSRIRASVDFDPYV